MPGVRQLVREQAQLPGPHLCFTDLAQQRNEITLSWQHIEKKRSLLCKSLLIWSRGIIHCSFAHINPLGIYFIIWGNAGFDGVCEKGCKQEEELERSKRVGDRKGIMHLNATSAAPHPGFQPLASLLLHARYSSLELALGGQMEARQVIVKHTDCCTQWP